MHPSGGHGTPDRGHACGDRNRGGRRRRRAQLAVAIVAPAPHRTAALRGARAGEARGHLRPAAVPARDRDRGGPIGVGPVADAARGVVAPAAQPAVHQHAAGPPPGGTQLGEGPLALDPLRPHPQGRGPVTDLTEGVLPPAPRRAVTGGAAGVPAPRRHAGPLLVAEHPERGAARGGLAVAELAPTVLAPAPHAAVSLGRAGVPPGGGDLAPRGTGADLAGQVGAGLVGAPELTEVVQPPAPQRPVGLHPAGEAAPGGHPGPAGARDLRGRDPQRVGAVAELAEVVAAPAPGGPVHAHLARALAPCAQRAGRGTGVEQHLAGARRGGGRRARHGEGDLVDPRGRELPAEHSRLGQGETGRDGDRNPADRGSDRRATGGLQLHRDRLTGGHHQLLLDRVRPERELRPGDVGGLTEHRLGGALVVGAGDLQRRADLGPTGVADEVGTVADRDGAERRHRSRHVTHRLAEPGDHTLGPVAGGRLAQRTARRGFRDPQGVGDQHDSGDVAELARLVQLLGDQVRHGSTLGVAHQQHLLLRTARHPLGQQGAGPLHARAHRRLPAPQLLLGDRLGGGGPGLPAALEHLVGRGADADPGRGDRPVLRRRPGGDLVRDPCDHRAVGGLASLAVAVDADHEHVGAGRRGRPLHLRQRRDLGALLVSDHQEHGAEHAGRHRPGHRGASRGP